jgi:hypothetical protein
VVVFAVVHYHVVQIVHSRCHPEKRGQHVASP